MALFYQLLSENELNDLSPDELEALKAAVHHALSTNETIKRELGVTVARKLEAIRAARQGGGSNP
jgi:hypothetical protein